MINPITICDSSRSISPEIKFIHPKTVTYVAPAGRGEGEGRMKRTWFATRSTRYIFTTTIIKFVDKKYLCMTHIYQNAFPNLKHHKFSTMFMIATPRKKLNKISVYVAKGSADWQDTKTGLRCLGLSSFRRASIVLTLCLGRAIERGFPLILHCIIYQQDNVNLRLLFLQNAYRVNLWGTDVEG